MFSQRLLKIISDKRVKTRATKHINQKKSPCVAFTPSKTTTARKQLKMTTNTPNLWGDMMIEAAPQLKAEAEARLLLAESLQSRFRLATHAVNKI